MGTGLEWVCFSLDRGVWVLDFMQVRFHNTGPGDFESMFIKAGDSEIMEGVGVQDRPGESLASVLLWLPRNIIGRK